jgi:hemerythrin superfamily protein
MPTDFTKDACDLLDADHIAVKHLFVEYARQATAMPTEAGDRQALAERICQELTVHARIEEEIFYPALRQAIDRPELLDEAIAEHQEAKDLIAQIQGMRAPDPQMDDLVAKLASAIEHHVKEEREDLFTKARVAPGLDLAALADQLKARQEELMGMPA